MVYFWVKLNGIDSSLLVLYRGDGIIRTRDGSKTIWEFPNVVSMAIPYTDRIGYARKHRGSIRALESAQRKTCAAIFATFRFFDSSAERMRDPLHPVANPQHRNVQSQHLRVPL